MKIFIRKNIAALLSVFIAFACFYQLTACSFESYVADDRNYTFINSEKTYAEADSDITLDGILSEEVYQDKNYFVGTRADYSDNIATLKVVSYAGEKGIYFGIDVDESMTVYVNHNRASYANACVETYLSINEDDTINGDGNFEIQLMADGTFAIRQRVNWSSWEAVIAPDSVYPILKTVTKGGDVNTEECTGYTHEFFVPYTLFSAMGLTEEGSTVDEYCANYYLISMPDYDSTDYNTRIRIGMADTYLTGHSWVKPSTWFGYDKNGMVSYDISFNCGDNGTVKEQHGLTALAKNESGTFLVTPDDGYTLSSLTLNGESIIGDLVLTNEGYEFEVVNINEDLAIAATFIQKSNMALTGSVKALKHGTTVGLNGVELTITEFGSGNSYNITLGDNGVISSTTITTGIYTAQIGLDNYKETVFVFDGNNTTIEMQYNFMTMSPKNYDPATHDFSHVNDEDAYITITGDDTLDAMTYDSYDSVSMTFVVKASQSTHVDHMQGIFFYFNDGTYFVVQVNGSNYNFQMANGLWSMGTLIGTNYKWQGYVFSTQEKAAYEGSEGVAVTVLRKGTHVYGIVGGEVKWDWTLPEIEGKQCQVGIYAYDTVATDFHFAVSTDISIVD